MENSAAFDARVQEDKESIRKAMKGKGPVTFEFLDAAEEAIVDNIYFQMVEMDYCKFGNDYALGLRWLRHLGRPCLY